MKKFIAIVMALMLVASVAVFTASAAVSPTEVGYYSMTAEAIGDGEASVTPAKIQIGSDGTATFTATEKGGKFIKWEFHCEYDVVSGNVAEDGTSTDKVVVLKPKSDIHGIAYFEGATKPASTDTGTTAPKTGDMTLVIAGFMILALGASVFAFKKIKE